jgi:hypothetical protein
VKPVCTICGRRTTPFVFIGLEPVGPTCARGLGLTKKKAGKGGRVRFVDYKPKHEAVPQTLDLFAEVKP